MNINRDTVKYTLGEGLKNLVRNKWYTLASVATIASCLFLFGIFFAISADFQDTVKDAQQNVSVTVFFRSGTTQDQIDALQKTVKRRDDVKRVTFVSADAAWDRFKKEYLGDYADSFTENPLSDSANLQIQMKDVSTQASLVKYLQKQDIVREVNYSDITAATLSGANRMIAWISMFIIVLLLAVSIFLISTTVTVGITARREEIQIMKYIGATDLFVGAPFLVEGAVISLVGSLLPIGLVAVFYSRVVSFIAAHFAVVARILHFLPAGTILGRYALPSVLLSVLLGLAVSALTLARHLDV